MGLFELKQKISNFKKQKLIKKLAVEEERYQKREILIDKEKELENIRSQIRSQRSNKNFKFDNVAKGVGKASVGVAKGVGKASVGVAKGVGKASVSVLGGISGALGQMEENRRAFEKKNKDKKEEYPFKF